MMQDQLTFLQPNIVQSFCLESEEYEKYLQFVLPADSFYFADQLQFEEPFVEVQQGEINSQLSSTVCRNEDRVFSRKTEHKQDDFETVSEAEVRKSKKMNKIKKKSPNWGRKQQRISQKKDQNMCKKYNLLAYKVISTLQKKGIIKLFKQKIYRKDFFLIVLLVAQICGVLKQFQLSYKHEYNTLKQKMQRQKKSDKQNQKKNIDLISGINKSIVSLELFMEQKMEEAHLKLFNLQNLRNKKFIQQSKKLICQVQQTIYQNTLESNI